MSNGKPYQTAQGSKGLNTFAYNSNGYLQKITNALSEETIFSYDGAGRLKTTTLPDSRVITYWYNDDGMRTGVTPPSRPLHSFGYDLNNMTNSYAPPLLSGMTTATTSYLYDSDKRLSKINRPDGKIVNYNYNVATGMLDEMSLDEGIQEFAYFTDSEILEEAISTDGVSSTYVPFGISDIKSEKISHGSHVSDVLFTRNNFFRVTNRTLKHNSSIKGSVGYTYRNNGQMSTAGSLAYGYNSNGRRDEATLDNLSESWTYDNYGQVSSYVVEYTGSGLPYSTVYSLNLTRDVLHRILTKTETIAGISKSYAYTYDSVGRLETTTVDGTDVYEYFYDNNSNKISVELNGVIQSTASFDDQDRLTSSLGNTYSYNATGELISKTDSLTTTNYENDSFGRLKIVTLPSTSELEYTLDWRGRRVEKYDSAVLTKRYIYESDLKLAAEIDISSGNFSEFVYSDVSTSPEYMIKGSTKYRFVKDQLGSIRLVVDAATGTVVQRMDYNEWGKVLADTNPNFQPFGFAGGLYELQTGLVRFGARDYDSEVGRWTSKDPILFNGGDTNLYGYTQNDPVNWIDPDGKFAIAPALPWIVEGATVIGVAVGICEMANNSKSSDVRECQKAFDAALKGCARGAGKDFSRCFKQANDDYFKCVSASL